MFLSAYPYLVKCWCSWHWHSLLLCHLSLPPSTPLSPSFPPLDPPTMPSTITAPVLTGSASSTLVDDKGHVLLSSPTLEALPESNLGSIVGGAVGGALFLLLLLSLVGVCYLRKQQTFHGNYYTKQYLGPNDLQKAPTQHELHPTKAGSSSHHQDHDREEWGDRQLKHERDRRHHSNNGEEYPSNGYTRAMRESSHHSHQQNHQREHTQYSSPRQARCARYPHSPKPRGNGSPYMSDDCYDSGPEGDYVSHTDGSVISRREWYVWQATWSCRSRNPTESRGFHLLN